MKTLLVALALSAAALMATPKTAVAQTDDTAIKTVIDDETKASHAGDYKAYLGYWAKVPYASFLIGGK